MVGEAEDENPRNGIDIEFEFVLAGSALDLHISKCCWHEEILPFTPTRERTYTVSMAATIDWQSHLCPKGILNLQC